MIKITRSFLLVRFGLGRADLVCSFLLLLGRDPKGQKSELKAIINMKMKRMYVHK